MSPKRYYVLTAQGELGPHTRLELRELLRASKVHADDQLRTAFGKTVGTVASILADPEEASSYRTPAVEVEEPVDVAQPQRRTRTLAEPEVRRWWRPVLLVVLGLLAIGAAWLLVKAGSQDASQVVINPVVERRLPVLSLSSRPSSWITGELGAVIVRLSQPSPVPLTVPLIWGGTAIPGVDVGVLPPQVEIPSDTYTFEVAVPALPASVGRAPSVQVTATAQGGTGWLLDHQPEVSLRLRSTADQTPNDPEVTWISDLPFVSEWNAFHPVNRDQSHDRNRLVVGGITYPRGLGMHPGNSDVDPVAHVTVRLAGAYDEFLSDIGLDAESRDNSRVVFQVWVDGKPQYDSGPMVRNDRPRSVRVPVNGAGELSLIVLDGGNGNSADHADWAGARLLKRH